MAEAAVQTNVSYLRVADFKLDGGTQPRAEIDEAIVSEYADAMKAGESFPPVVAFQDGASVWLADGFHRVHAARRADIKEIAAEVYDGTKRDAILHSVGANAAHGLRRTNADKRKAVMTLLEDDKWSQWSDREIARRCAVHNSFVSRLRASLSTSDSEESGNPPPRTYNTKHGTTATMNTENIGRRKPAANTNESSSNDEADDDKCPMCGQRWPRHLQVNK